MPFDPSISIIICTQNRSTSLRNTLDSLAQCRIPQKWEVEVLVVDNGSTDDTEQAVKSAKLGDLALRYCLEPLKGLSNARNTGLSTAWGNIILFTDDDVLVSEDWIENMAGPLLAGKCDAVTGLTALPPYLLRDWMEPTHKSWLSSTREAQVNGYPASLIGASMGFHRSVLENVPAFDPELGAGALGMSEDTLFGLQLTEAGYRIHFNPEARALHCFDPNRLRRQYWLRDAVKRGSAQGYLLHHWEHGTIAHPRREMLSYYARLKLRRLLQPPPAPQHEGCPPWEMSYIARIARVRQFLVESKRERLYEYRGLRRLDGHSGLRLTIDGLKNSVGHASLGNYPNPTH